MVRAVVGVVITIEGLEKCEVGGLNGQNNQILYSSVYDATTTYPGLVNGHNGYLVRSCENQLRNPYTMKKGVLSCAGSCGAVVNSCKLCGQDDINGVQVGGNIINVLASTSTNPFITIPGKHAADINLVIGNWANVGDRVAHVYGVNTQAYYFSPERPNPFNNNLDHASISSESVCSVGTDPTYKFVIK